MSKLERGRLILIAAITSLLVIGLCVYFIYATHFKADTQQCQDLLMQPIKNPIFFTLMEKAAEKSDENDINEKGYSTRFTWRDLHYRYMIFNKDDVEEIYKNPKKYFSDALKVIASPDFDQSQKMYTIMIMQELPIKEYMCLMDTANTAYEHNIITDKEVMIQAINPDISVEGTSNYYWWLPDWQQRFNKYANELFSKEHIEKVLSGNYKKYTVQKVNN